MAKSGYEEALRRLLAHEGGYTNHPSDPGGPTNFGITIHDYRKYVAPDATAVDVKTMTLDEAKRIYRAKYWDAQRCDELPAGVDYAVFDYGVNSGIGRSGKVLRRCLQRPDDTSAVTDTVIAAAMSADARALVAAICDERLRFLQRLKTWDVFGKGWGRRVAEVKSYSLALAAGAPVNAKATRAAPTAGKGTVPLAKTAQQSSAGAVAAAGAAAAQQAHQSGAHGWTIVAIVVGALVLAVGCWLFWRRRRDQQQQLPA